VRFEERDLFTACEALVGPGFSHESLSARPKGKGPGYPTL
jgi:hypothetical protein